MKFGRFALQRDLDALAQMLDGWDGDAAPAPSPEAISRAHQILLALDTADLLPGGVDASPSGGAGFWFDSMGEGLARVVSLMCLNTGSTVACMTDYRDEKNSGTVPVTDATLPLVIERIAAFLRGEVPALGGGVV